MLGGIYSLLKYVGSSVSGMIWGESDPSQVDNDQPHLRNTQDDSIFDQKILDLKVSRDKLKQIQKDIEKIIESKRAEARKLRDEGKIDETREVLKDVVIKKHLVKELNKCIDAADDTIVKIDCNRNMTQMTNIINEMEDMIPKNREINYKMIDELNQRAIEQMEGQIDQNDIDKEFDKLDVMSQENEEALLDQMTC